MRIETILDDVVHELVAGHSAIEHHMTGRMIRWSRMSPRT